MRKISGALKSSASGSRKPIADARTADQYAVDRIGALKRNDHAAGSSAGTKNDARSPTATQ